MDPFIWFVVLCAGLGVVHLICAVVASQIMSSVQDTDFGRQLSDDAEEARKSTVGGFPARNVRGGVIFGYHPLNERLWPALIKAGSNAPQQVQIKVWLLRISRAIRAVLLVALLASFVFLWASSAISGG